MTNNMYEDYAVLDAQIKVLTEQKDDLKVLILKDMTEKNAKKIDTSMGILSIATLKSWTYTKKVGEMEEAFKAQKAKEQETGDATFVEKPSLRLVAFKL